MSSISSLTKRYKIALFVGGLGCDGSFFDSAISKLLSQGSSLVKSHGSMLNMSNYNTDTSKFLGISDDSLLPTSQALKTFSLAIAEIVDLAKANPNKTIMVKTKLDYRPTGIENGNITYAHFDSIENQSIKLIKIIEDIKALDSSIEIILVGHSQGGLVNLLTATEIPTKISQIVSASTPYCAVVSASLLKGIDFLSHYIDLCAYSLCEVDETDHDEYDKRIATLSDPSYFTSLKDKWNALSKRPNLTVIAGISAHIMTSEYYFGIFEINHRYPFDGLVLGREQVDIDNCTLHVLHNEGVECYEDSDGFQNSCCSRFGLVENHVCTCPLPCLDIASAIFKSSISLLDSMLSTGTVNFEELPVIKALLEGINSEDSIDSCSNEDYRQYYEVMGGNYSHKHIIHQDDTIGLILGVFAK